MTQKRPKEDKAAKTTLSRCKEIFKEMDKQPDYLDFKIRKKPHVLIPFKKNKNSLF